ncbi:ATP-binding protein [Bacillus atrophaeus]|uniref:sensor histidine kinase n=1 Tax=Bacillus atrophaeus TaxID=1452 RepID=UPI00227E7D9A|nr:sensor histidine kinase [Bacillus atrophaeus]MCY8486952.1 ATP-binding protein [Bacillus atrophaeus]
MNKELSFKASVNVKNLIGKDLVTDPITAVFELVKNSYDADAKKVILEFSEENNKSSLIISDDGIGMDLEDIESKWMIIGTDSKKEKLYSEKFKRPINGDKGIGRFSVDRLGKKLNLNSTKECTNQKIKMHFNWNDFESNIGSLEDIKIPYEIETVTSDLGGVKLEILELRDKWEEKNIKKLLRNLQQFKSPFEFEDNFKIILHAPKYGLDYFEVKSTNLEEISSLWVETIVPIENQSKVCTKVVRNGIEYVNELSNSYNFGPLKVKVFFFNKSEKVSFKAKQGESVKDFGNIKLYRDNFRIHPYGESYNDWLDLDIRKAQGYARFFGSRDIIGYVQIYKEHNRELIAPTNRQGLIENDSFSDLRRFIIDYSIKVLEANFFKKNTNETFKEAENEVHDAVSELKKVTKEIKKTSPEAAKILSNITNVVQASQKAQSQYVKDQEELIEVYKRVASKEILLHQIIHQALIKVEKIITVTHFGINDLQNELLDREEQIGNYKSIKSLTMNAKEYLKKARDHLIRKKKPESLNLYEVTKEIFEGFSSQLHLSGISTEMDIPKEIKYKIDKKDYETILENLISNSIKSLEKTTQTAKKIEVKIIEKSNYITILFKDNGAGIPPSLKNKIFDPFFTTTDSSGMGLSILDDIIKGNKGELNLTISQDPGAEFQIKFRK